MFITHTKSYDGRLKFQEIMSDASISKYIVSPGEALSTRNLSIVLYVGHPPERCFKYNYDREHKDLVYLTYAKDYLIHVLLQRAYIVTLVRHSANYCAI